MYLCYLSFPCNMCSVWVCECVETSFTMSTKATVTLRLVTACNHFPTTLRPKASSLLATKVKRKAGATMVGDQSVRDQRLVRIVRWSVGSWWVTSAENGRWPPGNYIAQKEVSVVLLVKKIVITVPGDHFATGFSFAETSPVWLFYAIATVFKLYDGGYMMYEMKRRKLLLTQGIFNLPHNIGIAWQ